MILCDEAGNIIKQWKGIFSWVGEYKEYVMQVKDGSLGEKKKILLFFLA